LFAFVGSVKPNLVEMFEVAILDTARNYDFVIFHSSASIVVLARDLIGK